jgi:hypothetical protein
MVLYLSKTDIAIKLLHICEVSNVMDRLHGIRAGILPNIGCVG